jgi:two-component system response regulator MtrA
VNPRILLVEDDPAVQEITALTLAAAGMRVTPEVDGAQALARFRRDPFDAVVLDLMLPGLDGLEVCRRIRRTSGVPIVMVTAKGDTDDVVSGLEVGADDYVTKPFRGAELVARIRAVVRRATGVTGEAPLEAAGLVVDPAAFTVTKRGQPVELSATEFRLLVELMRHPGTVLTRRELLARVWDYDYMGDSRMVDMAVKRLRDRIEDDPRRPTLIATVRGVGYRFDAA